MKRVYIPLQKYGICACYEVENMGFCKDGVTRWYHFTSVDGVSAYTLKR